MNAQPVINYPHFSWLIRVGVGHLAGKRLLGVQDKKGFNHLLGALMDTTEQHHGAGKLKQMVRQIVQKQNRSQLRLSSRPSNVATTAAAAVSSTKKSSAVKSDAENAGYAAKLVPVSFAHFRYKLCKMELIPS